MPWIFSFKKCTSPWSKVYPNAFWDSLQLPAALNMISGYRKWMDGLKIGESAAHSLGGGWWIKEECTVQYII